MSETHTHWFWRLMTRRFPGPLTWLGIRRGVRKSAVGLIDASDLPAQAANCVREVVRRTRLWRGEKATVAMELIAHFQDGLEAGRSAEELVADFGPVKTSARLIRRGIKRNRPLWWRAQRRMIQALSVLVLIYIGMGVMLVVRHPAPSVDYVARLNAPIAGVPESDRAWPIYRKAFAEVRIWELDDGPLYLKVGEDHAGRRLHPGDSDWPKAATYLREHSAFFVLIRQAAAKPVMGWEFSAGRVPPEDQLALYGKSDTPFVPKNRADSLYYKSLISVMLPNLAPLRATANLLAGDLRLAADESDSARLLSDYQAMIGLARHSREGGILVNQLVAVGILNMANQTLMEINNQTPDALAPVRVELLHSMATTGNMLKIDLLTEKMFLLDMIQRIYSDNGRGDGSPTLDGMRLMSQVAGEWKGNNHTTLETLSLPAVAATMASRKDITEATEHYYRLLNEDASRPLWIKLHSSSQAEDQVIEWKMSPLNSLRYLPLTILAPSLNRAVIMGDRSKAVLEAAMTAIALEAYRDETGRYPQTLEEMVPRWLPERPVDYSSGGPLLYKLVDGKPVLYGVGKDGVDDGGALTDKKAHYSSVPDNGDWVLYPVVESEE